MEDTGHDASRVDLIIMGGTFTSRNPQYREWFVKRCFDALNGKTSPSLEAARDLNRYSDHRVVSLTVETRPDYFTKDSQVEEMVRLGATRVELGVQILDDDILAGVRRGHGVEEVRKATAACRRAGLSICYHLMPGLPGSSPEHDIECYAKVFDDPDFRPDNLKFYPVLVVGGTELCEQWKAGEYTPPDTGTAVSLLTQMKSMTPPYVRIQRIQRDIPVTEIVSGIESSNMRQMVQANMTSKGLRCRCIRCREAERIGEVPADPEGEPADLVYEAAGGREHFISFEKGSCLIAYARLRTDGSDTALLRELKVTGDDWQDRGYAEALLHAAEKAAAADGAGTLRVTCGAGAREFYSGLGYGPSGAYMVRGLQR